MSEKVFVKGPNGLVFGFDAGLAEGLLRHSDISKAKASADSPAPEPVDATDTPGAEDKPAGNAPTADWHAYALASGKTEAELEGLGQRDIRALFDQ